MTTFQSNLLSSLFAYRLRKNTEIYLGRVPFSCNLDASKNSQSDDFLVPEIVVICSSYVYCFSKNNYHGLNGFVQLYKFENSMMD